MWTPEYVRRNELMKIKVLQNGALWFWVNITRCVESTAVLRDAWKYFPRDTVSFCVFTAYNFISIK